MKNHPLWGQEKILRILESKEHRCAGQTIWEEWGGSVKGFCWIWLSMASKQNAPWMEAMQSGEHLNAIGINGMKKNEAFWGKWENFR